MLDPFIVEFTVAMLFALANGFMRIRMETDCQEVATAWARGEDHSAGGHLIREMRSYLPNF